MNKKKIIVASVIITLLLLMGSSMIPNESLAISPDFASPETSETTGPVISDNEATSENITTSTSNKNLPPKPDNGLMTRDEMIKYEPHIDGEEKGIKDSSEMTDEEILDVLELPEEELEDLEKIYGDLSFTGIKYDDAVSAVLNTQADREAKDLQDKANGNIETLPDVGSSNITVIAPTSKPDSIVSGGKSDVVTNGPTSTPIIGDNNSNNASNGIITTDKSNANNGNVTVGVADSDAVKTIVRVYGPDGSKTEYVVENGDWSNIPTDKGDGKYTINVYEDKGNGYSQIGQSTVTVGDSKPGSQSVTASNSDDSKTSNTTNDTKSTNDTEKVEDTKKTETVVAVNETTVTVEQTAPSNVEVEPTPAPKATNEQTSSAPMTYEEMLAAMGG